MNSKYGIEIMDVAYDPALQALARRIAEHHVETWQKGRSFEMKVSDILTGKVAERAVELYLQALEITYRSWDAIRNDDFKAKHAPLDGFFADANRVPYLLSERFATGARQHRNGPYFQAGILEALFEKGVYGYEVKATRIADRHLSDGKVDLRKLLKDSFLIYPKVRYGVLTAELEAKLLLPESKQEVQERMPPFLIQAHVEELETSLGWRVYLSGYILVADLLWSDHLKVKPLYKKGKSEEAIFYTVPVRCGTPLSNLATTVN
jgi:hypothetical protein